MQYAEVLVDTKADRRTFHYAIPPKLLSEISRGSFVRVPWRAKEVDGLVVSFGTRLPRGLSRTKLRAISRVIVPTSILPPALFLLASWMAEQYLRSFSDALFTMLPPFPQRQYFPPLERKGRSEPGREATGLSPRAWVGKTEGFPSQVYFVHGREDGRWKRYLQAIERTVGRGKQVVVIFPDLTRVDRFATLVERNLSIRTARYTAVLPKATRFRLWQRIGNGEFDLVIGTRLAVFAPARSVGLIILDEDSHPGHKEEQHPRYHAREVAVKRGSLEGVPILVGNLLPTLTTFAGLAKREVKAIELPSTHPPTTIVDVRTRGGLLSPNVEEAIRTSTRTIIFTTRLGAGAATRCQDCGFLFRCPNCTLPSTLHEGKTLRCHHCGHTEPLPPTCPNCHGTSIRSVGLGTESLEGYLMDRFPGRRIARLEANRPTPDRWDILVSTVKVLDTILTAPVVAISSLDTILELPDPFAVERAAQLLVQLRERATEQFIVQTRLPDHRAFRVLEDEEQFLTEELAIRRSSRYPPVVTLVRLLTQDTDQLKVAARLTKLANELKKRLSPKEVTVLGPGPAFYDRLKGRYRWHLLLKILIEDREVREKLRTILPSDVTIDVNPTDIL